MTNNAIVKMMKLAVITLGAVVGSSLLAGCDTNPVMAPFPGRPDLLPAEHYPQIAVTDTLDEFLFFAKANIQSAPDKPMSVSVPARLAEEYAVNVQYKFEFYNGSGRLMKPEMDFQYLRMPSRVQVFMSGAALDTDAVDWRLIVRSAK